MATLTPAQYDQLERAVTRRQRLVISRRGGTQHIVIPIRFSVNGNRETIEARHPSTGDEMIFHVDDIDWFEVVR
jgi:hypothetical protein